MTSKLRLIYMKRYDNHTEYIHLGKEVVLLPYNEDNKFVVIGVIQ